MAYLIIQLQMFPRRRVALAGAMTIGRSPTNYVWVDDPWLSREHCRIEPQGDHWMIVDLQSKNGTYMNGRRIEREVLIEGDALELGAVRILFQEGQYVENRPIDPTQPMARENRAEPMDADSLSNATLVGQITPARTLPKPIPNRISNVVPSEPAIPLAFTRPPARPIVPEEAFEADIEVPIERRGIISRLWRR